MKFLKFHFFSQPKLVEDKHSHYHIMNTCAWPLEEDWDAALAWTHGWECRVLKQSIFRFYGANSAPESFTQRHKLE